MGAAPDLQRIDNEADLAAGLEALLALDPSLAGIAAGAGALPLRRHPATFAELTRIITAQQVSLASAAAIQSRLEALIVPFEAATLNRLSDEELGSAGLSRAKIASFRAVAAAIEGGLDLSALAELPGEEAARELVAIRGVGPWTAEVFLLFCAGHIDIFPAGDVALRAALHDALGLPERPDVREAAAIARRWAPLRGVAARLMWAHYRVVTGRGTGLPV